MKILNSFKYIEILKPIGSRGISRTLLCRKKLKLKDAVAQGVRTTYDIQQVEIDNKWYEWWESQGFFQPENQVNSEQPYFSMILPPPNVTGTLHIGHALTNAIQDAIVRWCRMNGRQVVWIPGTDHAGIATQAIMEKILWHEQKKTIRDIGKEKFREEIWKWKNEKEEIIISQMKRLGSSLDWTKKTFTMDPSIAKAVTEAFVRLHEKGLIVRHKAFINWCCHLRTSVSDIEVQLENISKPTKLKIPGYVDPVDVGWLTHFAYPVDQSKSQQEIVVATTRPETIFGDVAVAVHPDDARYIHLHGQKVRHPFTGTLLPIICDEFVDMNTGTGAVKITPAHSSIDYNVALKHNLNTLEVIDETGHLINVPTKFKDLPRFIARQLVIKCLKEMGLLKDQVPYPVSLPLCSRSGDILESRLKSQWFVQCKDLAKAAMKAVSDGSLEIIPNDFIKNWNDWLSDSKDWCLSRQLVWGHRIPAYSACIKGLDSDEIWISGRTHSEALEKASKILSADKKDIILKQDEDVLDTWFSSAIYPFAILGWPDNTAYFKKFYPLSLMETGHDILTFWITRIVMLGQELTGILPFNKILLHGILCDAQGRKMSKSLGNVIDPMDVINGVTLEELKQQLIDYHASGIITKEEFNKSSSFQQKSFPNGIRGCGADALRFALCLRNIQDHTLNLDVSKVNEILLFCNKIWQATRFILSHANEMHRNKTLNEVSNDLVHMDRWILSRLATLIENCNEAFSSYKLNVAPLSLQRFIYYEFCDVYLEHVKPVLYKSENEKKISASIVTLLTCIKNSLLALSPFMPFLTEELYQQLPVEKPKPSICVTSYPQTKDWQQWKNHELEKTVRVVLQICHFIRHIKSEYDLKLKPKATVICKDDSLFSLIKQYELTIFTLGRCNSLTWATSDEQFEPNKYIIEEINPSFDVAVLYEEEKENHKKGLENLCKKELKLKQELKEFSKAIMDTNSDLSKRKLQHNNEKKEALTAQLDQVTRARIAMANFSNNFNDS